MSAIGGLRATSRQGLRLAVLIIGAWLISLISLLALPLASWPWWLISGAVLLRTFLQTGLFITAHDAMHGLLLPERPGSNQRLGALCLALYAGLPYKACLRNHQLHHRRQATAEDPDVPSHPDAGLCRWYVNFMAEYLSPSQMGRLLSFWTILALLMTAWNKATWINLLLFCSLPLLLSSLQLFIFGTYLPHRGQYLNGGRGRPVSLRLPPWLSLLACFHFGYHREHHDHPQLAWFELPNHQRWRHAPTSVRSIRVASQQA